MRENSQNFRGNPRKNVDCFVAKIVNAPRNDGFTLAEVLITLVIIGVIAAITVPTLITKYQKEQTVTRLKHTYSLLQNVVNKSIADHGDVKGWYWNQLPTDNGQRTQYFWHTYMLPYLNVAKSCEPATKDCFPENPKTLSGNAIDNLSFRATHVAYILNNGVALYSWTSGDSFTPHVRLYIDINGAKKPNVLGKDIFRLTMDMAQNEVNSIGISEDGNYTDTGLKAKDKLYTFRFPGSDYNLKVEDFFNPNLVSTSESGDMSKIGTCSKTCNAPRACGDYCGAAIQANSWQMPDMYPW